MPWQNKVAGCFGGGKSFASHHSDVQGALDLMVEARKAQATWPQVRRELKMYLAGTMTQHQTKELNKAKAFLKPWLDAP